MKWQWKRKEFSDEDKGIRTKNNVMTMIMIVMVIIINNNYHNGNKMIPINRIINNDSYSINNYVHDNN